MPPVTHGAFSKTPVEVTSAIPVALTNGIRQITEWTLTAESVHYSGKWYNSSFQAVVDVGNWLNVLPNDLAEEVNGAFSPPAFLPPGGSYYQVLCNATAPSFAVRIGNGTFPMDARDLIWRNETGSCFSSVASGGQDSDASLMFLGAAWLKNVVAVFDMGNDEMQFATRHPTDSEHFTVASNTSAVTTLAKPSVTAVQTGSAPPVLLSHASAWHITAVIMVYIFMIV